MDFYGHKSAIYVVLQLFYLLFNTVWCFLPSLLLLLLPFLLLGTERGIIYGKILLLSQTIVNLINQGLSFSSFFFSSG